MTPENAQDLPDQQDLVCRRIDARMRVEIKRLVTDELIEEHRRTMGTRRSDALERVLTYLRGAAGAENYAILTVTPFAAYRVVALSGRRGVPPHLADERLYPSQNEARQAVFLKRLENLLRS